MCCKFVCTTCILAAFREEGNIIRSLGLEFQVVVATENQTKVFCKSSKAEGQVRPDCQLPDPVTESDFTASVMGGNLSI